MNISIENLDRLNADDLASLALLDSSGMLFAPNETFEEYKTRISKTIKEIGELDNALKTDGSFGLEDICVLHEKDKIPKEIMAEAAEMTKSEYAFEMDWMPGFFLSKNLGPLWGGCAILMPEYSLAVFLIRSAFKNKKKWLIYRRDELLAHELCHTARMPLADKRFDENFAYKISTSALRRKLGSCFRDEADAIIFVIPILLLPLIQAAKIFPIFAFIPIWPFWILAMAYPLFLFIRNHLNSKILRKAESSLIKLGFDNPSAVLFRASENEIAALAKFAKTPDKAAEWLKKNKENEIRWKIIFHRFHKKNYCETY